MKIKKVTMEVVLELPANADPRNKILLNASSEAYKLYPIKITKEEDLGEVILPWQKAAHQRNMIRGLIIKLLKEICVPYTADVWGADGDWTVFVSPLPSLTQQHTEGTEFKRLRYEIDGDVIRRESGYKLNKKLCSLADPNLTGLRKDFESLKRWLVKNELILV